jgi:hypothetical protein
VACCCEHGNEPSDATICAKFPGLQSDCCLLKEGLCFVEVRYVSVQAKKSLTV